MCQPPSGCDQKPLYLQQAHCCASAPHCMYLPWLSTWKFQIWMKRSNFLPQSRMGCIKWGTGKIYVSSWMDKCYQAFESYKDGKRCTQVCESQQVQMLLVTWQWHECSNVSRYVTLWWISNKLTWKKELDKGMDKMLAGILQEKWHIIIYIDGLVRENQLMFCIATPKKHS